MEDLNRELWKLGIAAKTEHNEVAPAQHELAPIFTSANIATDQNQLIMETMKRLRKSTILRVFCTKSLSTASTAAANTTTGR